MGKKVESWLGWGTRLRVHVRGQKEITWAKIARELDQAESTVRSWCNGTRDLNLIDFFRLCQAAKADPQAILFPQPKISDEELKTLVLNNPWLRELSTRAAIMDDALSETMPPRLLARAEKSAKQRKKRLA